ncbi:MAG TPA: hydantoinase/oxoprolinase family protein [Candidatus Xenobia bacterium]|jgi:N-methylhydantoinase A/oxoprolinase/acetone carboxylase beta subunit
MTVRIGIDVGGTFTHAVAVDNESLQVVAHAVTPTTHRASEGVAAGIVGVFQKLQAALPPDVRIVLLAHSTTQATNALLEGDVAQVGIVGLGSGLEAVKAKADMALGPIELAPGKYLNNRLEFLPPTADLDPALQTMKQQGVAAVVAAEGFSVDDPRGERRIADKAAALGLPACCTHEMSGLYGLRVRTRTAVLNASILPKMMETALMTDQSLRKLNVNAPLMVMRSDGGVMSLDEVRRRPVLTLLSGPAAGIAAALMYLRSSDAVFLEVGGTSTDICLIKNGRAAVKSAQLGGHPTYLRTLDSRTLGIAGGSLLRKDGSSIDVGPRSAHLAGVGYASFTPLEGALKVLEVSPLSDDPPYLVVEDEQGHRVGITTTDAANLAGFVPASDYAKGDAARRAMEAVAQHLSTTADALARQMLERAAAKVRPTVDTLLKEYDMKDRAVKLIGGGGGAAAIVPFLAQAMGLPFEIAPRAEVISAIGAALAMVKETIEKNIMDPTEEQLAALRAEVEQKVVAMGADPGTIEVLVEVDAQRQVVRATATGAVEFSARDVLVQDAGDEGRLASLQETGGSDVPYQPLGATDWLHLYESVREQRKLFGLLKTRKNTVWVTDGRGSIKLQVPGAYVSKAPGADAMQALQTVISRYQSYGDAGTQVPAVHVIAGRKVLDLSALQSMDQMLSLAKADLDRIPKEDPVFFIVKPSA